MRTGWIGLLFSLWLGWAGSAAADPDVDTACSRATSSGGAPRPAAVHAVWEGESARVFVELEDLGSLPVVEGARVLSRGTPTVLAVVDAEARATCEPVRILYEHGACDGRLGAPLLLGMYGTMYEAEPNVAEARWMRAAEVLGCRAHEEPVLGVIAPAGSDDYMRLAPEDGRMRVLADELAARARQTDAFRRAERYWYEEAGATGDVAVEARGWQRGARSYVQVVLAPRYLFCDAELVAVEVLHTDAGERAGDTRTTGECRTLRRLTDVDADGVAELVYTFGAGEVMVISDGATTPMLRAGGYPWID